MDLAWKIVGIIAALLLAAAAVFSYLGKDAVKYERQLASRAKDNLKATRLRADDANASLKTNTEEFALAETQRDEAKKAVEETNAEEAEYVAEIASSKVQLEDVKGKVDVIKAKIRDAGNIEKLLADVESVKSNISEAEGQIVNRDQKLKIAVDKVEVVKTDINGYSDLERRQRKAQVATDFRANVASVHPRWGFVLLNKGNRQGVYANAELEIERAGQTIGKLFVTRVEQNRSVASVVADTWTPGSMPRTGDIVVAAMLVDPPTDANIDNVAPSDAPPVPVSPDMDLGGGFPGEEPTAPATDNPFGGDAMDAPAEAPAAPADDPFGGF